MPPSRLGQVSVEYLMVMGFVFLITIPLIVIFSIQSNEIQDRIYINQAENVARKVSTAVESVYYLGYPSKTTIRAYMPRNVQYATVGNNEIVIGVSTSNGVTDIIRDTSINITGSLQTFSGIQVIEISAMQGYVNITSS
jgi:hypothetical protein